MRRAGGAPPQGLSQQSWSSCSHCCPARAAQLFSTTEPVVWNSQPMWETESSPETALSLFEEIPPGNSGTSVEALRAVLGNKGFSGAPQLPVAFAYGSHCPLEGSLAFQQILCLEPIGTGLSGAGDSSKRLAERTCLLTTLEVRWDRV